MTRSPINPSSYANEVSGDSSHGQPEALLLGMSRRCRAAQAAPGCAQACIGRSDLLLTPCNLFDSGAFGAKLRDVPLECGATGKYAVGK